MMEILYVFFENQRVGELSRNEENIYEFSYDKDWNLFPLSLSMSLETRRFGNKITQSFFENLLPEGEVRKDLESSQGVRGVFDFLNHYGKDCAGAVVISSNPAYKGSRIHPVKKLAVDMDKIYTAIGNKQSVTEVIAEMDPGYLSLAGAQDKFPAIFTSGRFYLPSGGGPTTHIVKTPIRRMGINESVYNEYYCMKLAEFIGFKIPNCQIVQGQEPLFVIDRYDRVVDKDGEIRRLHQQDFCQAQGVISEKKYEIKGGPSIKDNYNLILEHVAGGEKFKALSRYLDWLCFNLIIGNNDCHSKNISFLLFDNKLQLAPFYDLLCTEVYEKIKPNFAFSIGGRNKYSEISVNQYHELESSLNLKQGTIIDKLKELSEVIFDINEIVLLETQEEFPEVKIFKRINDVIKTRLKSLYRMKVVE